MTKFIFVSGGVVSSVGKGITVASIGCILKNAGFKIALQKLDPYLNVDPGTMSPYQHGEVFVTKDGAETDLDLGHYERFIDQELTRSSNVTAGQIYLAVISRERRGDFLGGTIQVVPHVTNQIKQCLRSLAEETEADVQIVEVGGTVGDIESLPFLEAIRQMRKDVGRDNVLYIHLTLLPYISTTGELKTKPTQHSVKELRGIGIQPDIIVCRSDHPIAKEIKEKISLFCDVEEEAVFPLPTAPTPYEVPLLLNDAGMGKLIMERLGLLPRDSDLGKWRGMVEVIKADKEALPIAMVGKYVNLKDSYISVREALLHAGIYHKRNLEIVWVNAEDLEVDGGEEELRRVQGIVVPGGFGSRGIEGKIRAAQYAREKKIPYLGLCLGMQVMVIEFARHILDFPGANSTEFNRETLYPVIDLLPGQAGIKELGGTMRLGNYPCVLTPGTRAAEAYGQLQVLERHRHRFEFNDRFRALLGEGGLVASGISPDNRLVEICELRDHPWMVGTQFHPEFHSRPHAPHPLFREFTAACMKVMREGAQPLLPLGTKKGE